MPFRTTLDLEIALDEGSRVNPVGSGACVVGSVLLPGRVIEDAESALRTVPPLPKWQTASLSNALFVVDAIEKTGAYAQTLVITKDQSSSELYRRVAARVLPEDKQRAQWWWAATGEAEKAYSLSPDLFLRHSAFRFVLPIGEVVAHYAIRHRLNRYGPRLKVNLDVYLDKDDTPELMLGFLRRGLELQAEGFRVFSAKGVTMNVACVLRRFEMRPETARASLMLADYSNGIVAAGANERYQHSIPRADIAALLQRLHLIRAQHKTQGFYEMSLAQLAANAELASIEAQKSFEAEKRRLT